MLSNAYFGLNCPDLAMEKTSLPKGTRDFGPAQMAKRNFIITNIRRVFQKYGFQPLETPAMEKLETLTGKYGDEGDQLLFKILNSGDFLSDADESLLRTKDSKKITSSISEKGLRYDLTVPFARYVVMNRHEIALPFKRYQIQRGWRADRPQKGRYREFYQCDADVVGTDSLVCEAEIILMICEVFTALNLTDYSIKINHRAILSGLAAVAGSQENENTLFVAIDKLDKIGVAKVKEELTGHGFGTDSVEKVFDILNFKGTAAEKLQKLESSFPSTEKGKSGVADIKSLFSLLQAFDFKSDTHLDFDLSLARGLSYYTGCIFEVKINNVSIGSVSGGGRYDSLTQAFGSKEKLSGVGISFGIDRMYDAMEELGLFPEETLISSQVLVVHFDKESFHYGLGLVNSLRGRGVAAEIYPDQAKLKKQLEYADRKMIPYAIVIGPDEVKSGTLTLKKLASGEQEKLPLNEILKRFAKS